MLYTIGLLCTVHVYYVKNEVNHVATYSVNAAGAHSPEHLNRLNNSTRSSAPLAPDMIRRPRLISLRRLEAAKPRYGGLVHSRYGSHIGWLYFQSSTLCVCSCIICNGEVFKYSKTEIFSSSCNVQDHWAAIVTFAF